MTELNALARAEREAAGLLGPERLVADGNEWAVGDRLVCRRNDYRLGVRNGTRGSVVAVDAADGCLTLRTDEGCTVCLPAGYLNDADYGYAATGHVSQGETVDRTYLLASPGRGGLEWAYVAASRHRIDLRVYAVHHEGERLEEALAAAWSRSQDTRLALEVASPERRAAAVADARAQLAGELPERIAGRLEELRREREAVAALLRTHPEGAASRVRALRAEAERAVARALTLTEAAAERRDRLAALPFWSRRQRGALAREAAREEEEEEEEEEEATRLRRAQDAALLQATAIERGPDGPGRWEAAHRGARERYRALAVELLTLERGRCEPEMVRGHDRPRSLTTRGRGRGRSV